jgi:metal-responsive CopG/Arc/MetJ family transcriptional regulator
VEKQNVTLSLPVELLQKLRVMAAKRNVSMSSLMTSAITKKILDEDDYDARGKRLIERMKNATDRGTGGKITWTREELHERVRR